MKNGSHHSLETRARQRAANLGKKRPDLAGENSPMKRPEVKAKHLANTPRGDSHPAKRPEVKTKIAIAMRGDNNPMKRPEVAAKMAIARKGKYCGDEHYMKRPEMQARFSGMNSPHWLGGISREPYAWTFNEELKEAIRRRDGYHCQRCNKTQIENGRKLDVHHIDYNKRNSDPENLTALCRGCNGRVNTNRPYWTALFQKTMNQRAIA